MVCRTFFVFTILALALAPLVSGCADDSTTPGATTAEADFGGYWEIDLEVIAGRVCDRPVGTVIEDRSLYIAQRGGVARLFYEFDGVELAVSGSRARGSGSFDQGQTIEFDLTVVDGELSGTFEFSDPSAPCTELLQVRGTRLNATPNLDFEGDWDFAFAVDESFCEDGTVGSIDRFCRRIEVNGNSVSILDEGEGIILGVGDGDLTEMARDSGQYELRVRLEVSGDVISGTFSNTDTNADCSVQGTVTATRRTTPCGEDGPAGDFTGTWAWTAEEIDSDISCGLPVGPDCSEFVQQGNLVTIVSDGIQGTVSGNTLSASVQEALTGTVTITVTWQIELSSDGNSFTGTNSVTFSDSQEPEGDCTTVVMVSGTRTIACEDEE